MVRSPLISPEVLCFCWCEIKIRPRWLSAWMDPRKRHSDSWLPLVRWKQWSTISQRPFEKFSTNRNTAIISGWVSSERHFLCICFIILLGYLKVFWFCSLICLTIQQKEWVGKTIHLTPDSDLSYMGVNPEWLHWLQVKGVTMDLYWH